jgi:hypothetical protein
MACRPSSSLGDHTTRCSRVRPQRVVFVSGALRSLLREQPNEIVRKACSRTTALPSTHCEPLALLPLLHESLKAVEAPKLAEVVAGWSATRRARESSQYLTKEVPTTSDGFL